MAVAASHPHTWVALTDTAHRLVSGWVVGLVYVALLTVLVAGIWFVSRAAKRMTKPGRIIIAVIAFWTVVAAVVAFGDGYRPAGDWGGAIFEAAFTIAYGLVAAAIVLGVDKGVRRFRAAAPA